MLCWKPYSSSKILTAPENGQIEATKLRELYSEYGNLALDPEQSHGWDAGVEQRFWNGRGSVQATYFDRDTRDLITFVSCPFSGLRTGLCTTHLFGYYENVARASANGVELSGALRPLAGLELTANYTYTDARDRSEGSPVFDRLLARRPQNTANLSGVATPAAMR